MELTCKIQHYDWGKKGSQSKVATLYANVNDQFQIEENVRYAELWMGTHVNGPSLIKCSGELLSSVISSHPECLGEAVAKTFNNELPFLFKVLSIDKALSVQAHPNKKHAEQLHAKYPDIYKDSNHKPELAIALTEFEALCGFRPIEEIRQFVTDLTELQAIVGAENISDNTEFLKHSFRSILTCDRQQIVNSIQSLLERFKVSDEFYRQKYMAELIQRLNTQFPNDHGILMVYFLNYVKLQPTEAIFLCADLPHAYISGECLENMACSDNVVRAGLTPKLVDVDTLCSMLIYEGGPAEDTKFKPINEDSFTKLYKPPVEDFAVAQIQVPVSVGQYRTLPRKSASILLVISGRGHAKMGELKAGLTLFLPANEVLEVSNITEDLLIYQALANVV